MIRILYADQLAEFPLLRASMFRDRAEQFSTRQNWDVSVDVSGFETDAYDAMNPLYVIWQKADGSHGGSMRFLPTTGPVMVNDHFGHLTGGGTITSPLIWEVTRFCISPNAGKTTRISAHLMLAGAELGRRFHLAHAVGVFDTRMIRIYNMLGWPPDVLGTDGTGPDAISVGLWDFSEAPLAMLRMKAGISQRQSSDWFDQSFGVGKPLPVPA